MNIVIDTSAAINSIIETPYTETLQHHILNSAYVFAPDVYIPEVTNVLWKYYMFHNFSSDLCKTVIDKSIRLIDKIIHSNLLYKEAFKLSTITKHSTYDCYFLVLARQQDATLLTLDKKLIQIAQENHIQVINLYNENLTQ
ncbi:MAG: type II toxin-antitoxin system VapC family toxin [Fidelibacterota bacterium]